MPNNVKTYDGTGDPEDHLKIIQAAAHVERWAMPTWCHMFNSTLIGAARVWFDELPPEIIDGYKGLKAAFLAYFMQQKKYVKDLVEIHNIKQRDGETIEEFKERFKFETERMKGSLECMRIFGFMHGVNNPELTKCLNEHVPKTDQSKRHTSEQRSDFQNQPKDGQGSNKFTRLTRTPKEIFADESGKFKQPPPMVTPVEKRSNNKFCEFHNDKGYNTDECVQLRKQIEELGTEGPLVIEAEIGGHAVHHIYVDGGSSMEVLYEHYFNRLRPKIKSQMVPATTSLIGFHEETIWPLGQLRLLVTIGDAEHYTKAWMNFMIVRSPSPYNGIIERPEIREIQAVPSTAHGMLKFPVNGGIVTIRSTILTLTERATIAATPKDSAKKAEARHKILKGQASEPAKAIQVEVQKLVEAGILREVYYHDWLSNPVMVRKHDGQIPLRLPLQVFPGRLQRLSSNTDGGTSRRNVSRIHDQSGRDKTVPRQDEGRIAAPIPMDN
uniref:Reverse transcriptase domain-containing protein n=1 Tax=Tanacetum cinerariifolium TaxID=118510 RepID=A0A6L2NK40_TANCI|nr:reverse transcriptase domain-containing protein [Tanacetum cinerariifolium]